MVDFGESDKMIKISGKGDKSSTMGLLVTFCSLFAEEFLIFIINSTLIWKEKEKFIKYYLVYVHQIYCLFFYLFIVDSYKIVFDVIKFKFVWKK